VTHDREAAHHVDRVLTLRDGRLGERAQLERVPAAT
jgi:ABC-type lipoprotein export system ATPase subunit